MSRFYARRVRTMARTARQAPQHGRGVRRQRRRWMQTSRRLLEAAQKSLESVANRGEGAPALVDRCCAGRAEDACRRDLLRAAVERRARAAEHVRVVARDGGGVEALRREVDAHEFGSDDEHDRGLKLTRVPDAAGPGVAD